MKIPPVVVVVVAGLLYAVESVHSQSAATLQNRGQEKNNWCWNGCSEMVLDWKGINRSQTEIGDWAVGGADIGNSLDAGGIGPFKDSPSSTYFRRGVKQVLRAFGPVPSQRLLSALSWAEVKDELAPPTAAGNSSAGMMGPASRTRAQESCSPAARRPIHSIQEVP